MMLTPRRSLWITALLLTMPPVIADAQAGAGRPGTDPAPRAARPIELAPRSAAGKSGPAKTGTFKITLSEEDGVDAVLFARLLHALGGELKPKTQQAVRRGEIKWFRDTDGPPCNWEVYVPDDYDGTVPYGLIVFINSGDWGGVQAGLQPVLDKHRLIWIGANQSGNTQGTALRHGLALRGVDEIKSRYQVDPDRVYVSGFSGGGRVTSQVMIMNSDVFSGGMPLCGANPYRRLSTEKKSYWDPVIKHLDPRAMKHAKKNGRFVFLTGETDANREQTGLIAQQYRDDGFRFVHYVEVPGMGHTVPPADWFEKGVVALDAPLAAATRGLPQKAAALEKRGRLGAAAEAYTRVVTHAGPGPSADEAQTRLTALHAAYDAEVTALEEVFAEGDVRAATAALRKLRQRWGKTATDDADRFQTALKAHRKPIK